MRERYWLLGLAMLIIVQPVSAYLDPGTGSFIWQMMIGIALGAGFMLKVYWQKLKASLRKR